DNANWENPAASSWSIVHQEFPQNENYDTTRTARSDRFGTLYGRWPVRANGEIFLLGYVGSTYYIRPTNTFRLDSLLYKFYVDEPFWWELMMDTNLAADIYIGQVVGGNYTGLVASSLLMADYQRPTRGNLIEDIDISAANYTITGGNTYGIRFVPK